MKKDHQEEPTNIQLNLGENQRNAARDYVEVTVIQSAEAFLEIASEEKIDERTLHNPRLFKRRFGVEIANPEVRAATIALRREMQLTDREMCSLRKAGHLLIRPGKVELQPCRLTTLFGYVLLTFLSLNCALSMLRIELGSAPASKQIIGEFIFSAFWFCGVWALYKMYIEPARVLKRIGA